MAIHFYNKGDHPAGFVGFRVAITVKGQVRQHYYSVPDPDPDSLSFKRVRYQAYLKAVQLLQEAIEHDYLVMVTQSHPRTLSGRELGVHGLTMCFRQTGADRWIAAFVVHRFNDYQEKVFAIDRFGFHEAWRSAVALWAEMRDIDPEDAQWVRDNPPDPQRFKALRRIENEQRGADIPVEALEPVFRHQREQIRSQRQTQSALAQVGVSSLTGLSPVVPDQPASPRENGSGDELASEITRWFQDEAARYTKHSD